MLWQGHQEGVSPCRLLCRYKTLQESPDAQEAVFSNLLVCLEDLESGHDLCKGDAAVLHPILDSLLAVHENDEAVCCSLEDHFGLRGVSARHVVAC
jgi:hypothetical protein